MSYTSVCDSVVLERNLITPVAFQSNAVLVLTVARFLRNPEPTYASVCFSLLTPPVKEKSICSSSGLTVIDSAVPLSFLRVPVPSHVLERGVSVREVILNNPSPSNAAANVSDAPLNVKRFPEPSKSLERGVSLAPRTLNNPLVSSLDEKSQSAEPEIANVP